MRAGLPVTVTVNEPVRSTAVELVLSEAVNVNVALPEPSIGLTVIPLLVSGDIVHSKPVVAVIEPVTLLVASASIIVVAPVASKEEPR